MATRIQRVRQGSAVRKPACKCPAHLVQNNRNRFRSRRLERTSRAPRAPDSMPAVLAEHSGKSRLRFVREILNRDRKDRWSLRYDAKYIAAGKRNDQQQMQREPRHVKVLLAQNPSSSGTQRRPDATYCVFRRSSTPVISLGLEDAMR